MTRDTERPPQRTPSGRIFALIERILLFAGICLFLFLLYRTGLAALWANLVLIGWGFALILGQEIVAFVLNTEGWRWAFPAAPPRVPFRRLLAARIAGDAINNLTPTATIGGEVVRARMLEGEIEDSQAWASVAIAKLAQTLGQIVFIVFGLVLTLEDTPLPDGIRQGLLGGLVFIAVGLTIAIVLQRRGMFSAATSLVRRLGFSVPLRLSAQIEALDREIARFYTAPGPFLRSAAFFLAGWLMGVVEIYIILYFLGIDATWHLALTIEALSMAIEAVLFFVPAKAGTQEGGKVLIFSVLGLPPAKGLALGVARRIRELFWSLVGLLLLSHHQARKARAQR